MRFQVLDILPYIANPVTARLVSPAERFAQALTAARRAEELGYDAVALGERHAGPFLSAGVPVLLGAIAATTSRVRCGVKRTSPGAAPSERRCRTRPRCPGRSPAPQGSGTARPPPEPPPPWPVSGETRCSAPTPSSPAPTTRSSSTTTAVSTNGTATIRDMPT